MDGTLRGQQRFEDPRLMVPGIDAIFHCFGHAEPCRNAGSTVSLPVPSTTRPCSRDGLSADGDVDAVAGLLVVIVHDLTRLARLQRLSNPVEVAAVLAEERRVRKVEQW